MNPYSPLAPEPRFPFQPTSFTVTEAPVPVRLPFHMLETAPPEGKENVVVQPVMAEDPAVTTTFAW